MEDKGDLASQRQETRKEESRGVLPSALVTPASLETPIPLALGECQH